MKRYLISFDDGTMNIPPDDLPAVAAAAHQVASEAKRAGVWIFGAGIQSQRARIVGTDGTIADGPSPEAKVFLGGFSIIEVASENEAMKWAAKFAVACRCAQEVRELMFDPES